MSFWRLLAHATKRARVSHPAYTRLSGRWLLLARVAWLSVAALGITLTILSIRLPSRNCSRCVPERRAITRACASRISKRWSNWACLPPSP